MGKNKKKSSNNQGNNNNKQIHKSNDDNQENEQQIIHHSSPPKDAKYPFVSICTPTYNRRPFISAMLKCFDHQTYPKHRMEWIIIDDGTDKIEELVKDHPNVKYFKYDEKMTLGRKRNLLHEKCIGEILVYMDDDDYYPPERVSHAVEMLQTNPTALCAGSSEIYIYFKHIHKMFQFGPYKQSHATAGTFAFRRELIQNKYDDDACLAEEKAFLKNYTVPFVQLEPLKTILVFSHDQNTFDKRNLLDKPHPQFVKESVKTVDNFVKEKELKDFYMNVDSLLEKYSPGDVSMKPDVLKQMLKIEETRRKKAEDMVGKATQQITIQRDGQPNINLDLQQAAEMLRQQQQQAQHMKELCDKLIKQQIELKMKIKSQEETIIELQTVNSSLTNKLKIFGEVVSPLDIVRHNEPSVDIVIDSAVNTVIESVVNTVIDSSTVTLIEQSAD